MCLEERDFAISHMHTDLGNHTLQLANGCCLKNIFENAVKSQRSLLASCYLFREREPNAITHALTDARKKTNCATHWSSLQEGGSSSWGAVLKIRKRKANANNPAAISILYILPPLSEYVGAAFEVVDNVPCCLWLNPHQPAGGLWIQYRGRASLTRSAIGLLSKKNVQEEPDYTEKSNEKCDRVTGYNL